MAGRTWKREAEGEKLDSPRARQVVSGGQDHSLVDLLAKGCWDDVEVFGLKTAISGLAPAGSVLCATEVH